MLQKLDSPKIRWRSRHLKTLFLKPESRLKSASDFPTNDCAVSDALDHACKLEAKEELDGDRRTTACPAEIPDQRSY